ncbi:MAG: hypothetical protein U0350_33040 [Caldilineaceae bacterium]
MTVEDRVVSFFPEDLPVDVSENLAAMSVRDLLAMATGHTEDTTGYIQQTPDGNWVKAFLARPVTAHRGRILSITARHLYVVGHHPENYRAEAD